MTMQVLRNLFYTIPFTIALRRQSLALRLGLQDVLHPSSVIIPTYRVIVAIRGGYLNLNFDRVTICPLRERAMFTDDLKPRIPSHNFFSHLIKVLHKPDVR